VPAVPQGLPQSGALGPSRDAALQDQVARDRHATLGVHAEPIRQSVYQIDFKLFLKGSAREVRRLRRWLDAVDSRLSTGA